jgi:hypothetical protein
MFQPMRPEAPRALFPDAGHRLELVLYLPDRRPWPLTLSPGMERFVGYYPRVEGIESGTQLLEYSLVRADA